jgi:hypothetical protein
MTLITKMILSKQINNVLEEENDQNNIEKKNENNKKIKIDTNEEDPDEFSLNYIPKEKDSKTSSKLVNSIMSKMSR